MLNHFVVFGVQSHPLSFVCGSARRLRVRLEKLYLPRRIRLSTINHTHNHTFQHTSHLLG
jgi:hypothetical protein